MASQEGSAGKAGSRLEAEARETVRHLEASYEQLRGDLDRLRQELLAAGAEQGGAARAALEARLEKLRGELEGLSGELRARSQAGLARAEGMVRERPVTSLLAAFGIGMLIAHLLERR